MTFEYVKHELKAFFANLEPEILAIKGKWGTGKTYLVKEVFEESQDDKAYVSLFGISTIEDLQEAIFVQLISNRASKDSSRDWRNVAKDIFENTGNLGKWAKTGMKVWMTQDFDKATIVIDDLERRGNDLRLQDVLGYCFNLKEQEKWKVILILNEGALDDDESVLNILREKVIDIELELAPTPTEVIEICNLTDNQTVATALQKLGANNIRVVQRIEKFLEQLEPLLENHPEIREKMTRSATILAWLHYARQKEDKLFKFVKTLDRSAVFFRQHKRENFRSLRHQP